MTIARMALAGLSSIIAYGAMVQRSGPSDAQIAAIVVTANQVDIEAGNLAKTTSRSKSVREFAQLMITDHGAVNQSASGLVQKLHVTPESNPTSVSLKRGGDENLFQGVAGEGPAGVRGPPGTRQNVVPMVSATTQSEPLSRCIDEAESPDASVTRTQVRALLERKIDELPDSYRMIFVLRSVEEMTVDETAVSLGIPEETVRSRHDEGRLDHFDMMPRGKRLHTTSRDPAAVPLIGGVSLRAAPVFEI